MLIITLQVATSAKGTELLGNGMSSKTKEMVANYYAKVLAVSHKGDEPMINQAEINSWVRKVNWREE